MGGEREGRWKQSEEREGKGRETGCFCSRAQMADGNKACLATKSQEAVITVTQPLGASHFGIFQLHTHTLKKTALDANER